MKLVQQYNDLKNYENKLSEKIDEFNNKLSLLN